MRNPRNPRNSDPDESAKFQLSAFHLAAAARGEMLLISIRDTSRIYRDIERSCAISGNSPDVSRGYRESTRRMNFYDRAERCEHKSAYSTYKRISFFVRRDIRRGFIKNRASGSMYSLARCAIDTCDITAGYLAARVPRIFGANYSEGTRLECVC